MKFDNYYGVLKSAPDALLRELHVRFRDAHFLRAGERAPFMQRALTGKFEGWCYQSASLSALMLDDNAVVSHGVIDLPEHGQCSAQGQYRHAWVDNIIHRRKKYIFDPALSMLANADEYNEIFNARVRREIPAETIKQFAVDVHRGIPLDEYGDRGENYGHIRGVCTDDDGVAIPGEHNDLPNPYFFVSVGAKEGLLVGPVAFHLKLSKLREITGFDSRIYMGG